MYPKIIFIVPYRNRPEQKFFFETYMAYILEDVSNVEIFFIEQNDNLPFNRGAIKNSGFILMKKKYPQDYKNITFVFNDVDTVPYKKNLINYATSKGIIKHFYGYEFALGGILSITGHDFEMINGFPNFWGWGLEDNVLNKRALRYALIIDRDNFYDILSNEIIHLSHFDEEILSSVYNLHYYNDDNPMFGIMSIKLLSVVDDKNTLKVTFNTEICPHYIYLEKPMLKNHKMLLPSQITKMVKMQPTSKKYKMIYSYQS